MEPKKVIDGISEKSFFSGKEYIYFEIVLYFKDDSYTILHHSENPIKIGSETFEVYKIRVKVEPTETRVTKKDLGSKKQLSEFEKYLLKLISEKGDIVVKEYGLEKGKKYTISSAKESYHLPPVGDGKPEERTNRVTVISDGKTKDYTPRYSKWMY